MDAAEKQGVSDLLNSMEIDVVLSIAGTCCKNKLVLSTFDEALTAILLHSESAKWLLNRKKVTRQILFEYLHSRKVPVLGQAEKLALIDQVLDFWKSSFCVQQLSTLNNEEQLSEMMGVKFTQWWFEILLAISSAATVKNENLADQFWADGRLKITINSAQGIQSEDVVGSNEAEKLLLSLLHQGYLLNPNLKEVKEKHERHGFVLIAVCGTVHKNQSCIGVFENIFGLLRDPGVEFRWRLKWSELQINTSMILNQTPCISNMDFKAVCE